MINRRKFSTGAALSLAAPALITSLSNPANAVETDENGLHIQDWFVDSFLEIADDQADANDQNKHLAIIFEQRGCPYCAEMHAVNLQIPQITDYIKANFNVLQLNLWGSREVTDIDGEQLEERAFGLKWRVNFTPTVIFLRQGDLTDAPPKLAEAARIPGLLKPFHFLSMFEFVAGKNYQDQSFPAFLKEKLARYKAEGKKPEFS